MLKRILCIVTALLTALVLFTSCSSKPDDTGSGEKKLKIVASVFPAYDFARAVVKDRAEIKMLMKPGGEVHSYAPTADDMLAISQCDLFICIGGESDEGWIQSTIEASGNTGIALIRMTDSVKMLTEAQSIEPEKHEEGEEAEEESDEHVWTSPKNAEKIVNTVAKAVSVLDPDNADFYSSNAAEYNEKLSSLDMQFRDIAISSKIKTLIFADRFPFRYFCEEYGFESVSAFSGCSASADPSAETITTLVNTVKLLDTDTVFVIEFSSGATADTVCEATGAKKAELHSCHNVSQEDFDNGITYIDLMNRNVSTLKEVLNIVSD